MPSVGMRRTTRVFGVVKGADGARVLRSGRRLWPDFGEGKLRRSHDGDEWYHHAVIKKNNGNGPGGLKCKNNGWSHVEKIKLKLEEEEQVGGGGETEMDEKEKEMKVCKIVREEEEEEEEEEEVKEDRMYGIVYSRKRRRVDDEKSEFLGDKRYRIQFRRQRRKKGEESEKLEGFTGEDEVGGFRVFGVGLEISCSDRSSWFACFLSLVLGYMKRRRVELTELASFLLSQPISGAFSLYGIRFLWDPPIGSTGMCKLFGAMQDLPLFSVDFSAVPSCFMYIHYSMLVRLRRLPSVLVNNLVILDSNNEIMSSIGSYQPYESSDEDEDVYVCETKTMVPEVDNAVNRVALQHPSVTASKLAGRNVQYRNSLNSRAIQKRRSSLRRRRARNPSLVGSHKGSGALVSDLVCSRKNGIPFSSVVSKNKLKTSMRSSPASSFKEVSSSKDQMQRTSVPSCCSASILIIESDRCYRERGANVMLEMSSSREWFLVVKKDGVTRYTHSVQKTMRPCSSNRVTHAIIWTGDDNWKLEFLNRQDWLNFKDLYKECSDRNLNVSVAKVIPVPGVWMVSGYGENDTIRFYRPDSYISVIDDEVSRALVKRTANYDLDSEDEEWLKKFNNEFFAENELEKHVSGDSFELMVDAFEKAYFCSPDDLSNEEAAVNLCLDLGRRDVVLAVYGYWMKKRKQKRSGLLRVFQGRQVKKPLITKPPLRKRRSFKRQASQLGRGKQPGLLQAIAARQDALEEQNAMVKVEEAKASAKRSVESAVLKRQRAQLLMEIADLATYRAAMALRIAEAAQVGESADAAAAHFLD